MSGNGHSTTINMRIQRFNPDVDQEPYFRVYEVQMTQGMTILDALHNVKTMQDGSVTYRRSCRHGICGSCALNINGKNTLVCEAPLKDFIVSDGLITIAPLSHMPVIKDLVVDRTSFWDQYLRAQPWLVPPQDIPEQEFRVSPEAVSAQLDAENCIMCGACYSSCRVVEQDKAWLGPHALLKNFLRMHDPRDTVSAERLADLNDVWDCITCYDCVEQCPKDLKPGQIVPDLRSLLVEEGKTPRQLGVVLTSIFRNGNPFESAREDRMIWADDLALKNALEEPVDALYYAGCMACYDPRGQKAAQAMFKSLRAAGVDVGTFGADETCCGSEVRRLGELGLFEMMVEEGNELLASAQAQRMLTASPHCFDAYTKHYADPGYPIQHYTQYIAALLAAGKFEFKSTLDKKITYHDPCYLGKQNGIYEEPRSIIAGIPGVEFVEMEHNRAVGICCGGGGGKMWFEGNNPEVRVAPLRIQETLDVEADIVATACPFCLNMLEDAAKTMGVDEQVQVMDIMELVVAALE